MKKNLVYIHLESLNHAIYGHRQWFPCLNSIYSRSLRMNNFISTATSSIMALSDLVHGDDDVLEHNFALEEGISVNRTSDTLFDQLQMFGYQTQGIGYPKSWASVDSVWSRSQSFHWHDSSIEMLAEAEEIVADKTQPFALYFWNLSSHLCYADAIKRSGQHSFENWQLGYKSMDNTIGHILQLLIKHQQLENTIIVGFGDHGDDFWNHGYNGGFAHSIEPYTSLVHTPAFIFDPSRVNQDINHLVSLTDLKQTTLDLMGLPYLDTPQTPSYSALSGQRKYCFSRNLFSQQPDSSSESPLHKGYSITSDFFHLLYSNGGYQMFAWQADTANQFDLLSLFVESDAGEKRLNVERLGKGRLGGPHPHITRFLGENCHRVIQENYCDLRARLDERIAEKNSRVVTQSR